ncbi:hypothetical protein VTJ49DRAFT_2985 [Mycothermus thermophilus]|uniref:J domain-containing protein n=1 Tax=Humicola insolens TaxID=85995 RepID=A0ABR3V8T9_HUMIN
MTSTLPPDPWKALGVERTADKAEIRSAYKKLVLKCHPDKIQDPALKALKADEFQKVQQAYELLNDDVERTKYEQKLRLAELQRAKAQQDVKTSPNISVPRSSAKYSNAVYEVPSPERPKYKSSSSSEKLYTHSTATPKRSHEEISIRIVPVYEEPPEKPEKTARRTASYEKSSRRDEERREREREERRRRKEEEELEREREKEKEREREKEKERKAEKKRLEKERERERDKDRRRAAEDKRRPYLEEYHDKFDKVIQEDEKYVTGKSDKKKSSSKKHDETRERERDRERRERDKSSSRRAKSPHVTADQKHQETYEAVIDYIAKAGSSLPSQSASYWSSQSPKDRDPPAAPTPPPVDFEDEAIRHTSSRHRRSSNEAARSREKLKQYDVVVDVSPKSRPIPSLTKAYTTIPESSPPRSSRTQSSPIDAYAGPPPLARNQTWAPGMTSDYEFEFELDEDHDRRRHRGSHSRRNRSPSGHRYKSSSKVDPSLYAYGESPTSRRSYTAADVVDPYSRSPTSYRDSHGFRVKMSKEYSERDVSYAQYGEPVYYTPEGYPVGVA